MQKDQLNNLLRELYAYDANLRRYEKELIAVITQMSDLRPDTGFSPVLAQKIKDQLMLRIQNQSQVKEKIVSFNIFNNMNKNIYIYAGLSAVFVLAISIVMLNLSPTFQNNISQLEISDDMVASEFNYEEQLLEKNQDAIVRAPAQAFGSLRSLAVNGENNLMATKEAGAPLGLGGDSMAVTPMPIEGRSMIAPYFNLDYKYIGDDVVLDEQSGDVFQRLPYEGAAAVSVLNALSGFKLADVSLANFDNLRAQSLSVVEDKDKGLGINFDFVTGTVNMYENWPQWRIPERENCGDDQACWRLWRVKIEDVPSDVELITLANNFLSEHQIKVSAYGQAIVDNNWRLDYERSADKENYYIPEYVSVIYPLLINDQAVRDQSGNYAGLRVTVNIVQKRVSGLNNLSVYRYQASSYPLVTDFSRIVKAAENGGWNNYYFFSEENNMELNLDTPELSYVQIWRYANNENQELLIPAFIFPVINTTEAPFFAQRFIIVPLVQEMLEELEQQQAQRKNNDNGNNNDGVVDIMPIPMLR